jgi:predicted transcriptional regulator
VATTVHLPDDLLRRTDERARAQGITRNRFIADAVRQRLEREEGWSPEFMRALATLHPTRDAVRATREMMAHITHGRRNRKSPPF